MSAAARRVAARYLRAKSIANVHDLTTTFERQLDVYSSEEADLELMLEAQDKIAELLEDLPGDNEDNLDRHEQQELDDNRLFISRNKHRFISFPERSYKAMLNYVGARQLFWALMQQYALSPQHLKKVEQYSKFYAKARMGNKKDIEQALAFFPKLMEQYQDQLATVKEILATTELRGENVDGVRVMGAGPFKVVNTGGFDQATMEKAARVVKEAAKRMKAKGLGKACYGEVLVSNQIGKKNVLAFYVVSSDEMFIRADLQGHEHDAVKTMLHELGHRVHFKFLKGWDRGLRSIYQIIKQGQADAEDKAVSNVLNDPALTPKPGDILVDPKKKNEYVVNGLDYRGGEYTVKLSLKEEPKVTASISLKGYLANKGIQIEVPKAESFVTAYAGKNHEENFAEMLAFLCMDELPQGQVDMLELYLDHMR